MSTVTGAVRWRLLLRSFAVQGSWNYETLIGGGFAFILIPALRAIHGRDTEAFRSAVARHSGLFNSHPYLTPLAAGAVARLEAEGVDPGVIERFKTALRGSLGSIGDQLVWGSWRPTAALAGLVLLLLGFPWWVAVGAFLLLYNALHLWLRVWGVRAGWESGAEVGRVLRNAPFQPLGSRGATAGAFLAGVALVLAAAPSRTEPVQAAVVGLAIALGFWLGVRTRRIMIGILAVAWAAAVFLASTTHGS